jgi:hypothetical protein
VRKIAPTPGFDTQAIQLIASHYTDTDTRPTPFYKILLDKETDLMLFGEYWNLSGISVMDI